VNFYCNSGAISLPIRICELRVLARGNAQKFAHGREREFPPRARAAEPGAQALNPRQAEPKRNVLSLWSMAIITNSAIMRSGSEGNPAPPSPHPEHVLVCACVPYSTGWGEGIDCWWLPIELPTHKGHLNL